MCVSEREGAVPTVKERERERWRETDMKEKEKVKSGHNAK